MLYFSKQSELSQFKASGSSIDTQQKRIFCRAFSYLERNNLSKGVLFLKNLWINSVLLFGK